MLGKDMNKLMVYGVLIHQCQAFAAETLEEVPMEFTKDAIDALVQKQIHEIETNIQAGNGLMRYLVVPHFRPVASGTYEILLKKVPSTWIFVSGRAVELDLTHAPFTEKIGAAYIHTLGVQFDEKERYAQVLGSLKSASNVTVGGRFTFYIDDV